LPVDSTTLVLAGLRRRQSAGKQVLEDALPRPAVAGRRGGRGARRLSAGSGPVRRPPARAPGAGRVGPRRALGPRGAGRVLRAGRTAGRPGPARRRPRADLPAVPRPAEAAGADPVSGRARDLAVGRLTAAVQ